MSGVDLSVLICSTHTRYLTFAPAIASQVWEQYAALPPDYQARLEIIILTDNRQMTLGDKRNVMVGMAQGRYVQFVDDDDRIAPDMFATVLDAIDSGADVITFLASVKINGGKPKLCRFSKDLVRDCRTRTHYGRLPNHICCVRRELALKAPYPAVSCGEDVAYSKKLKPLLRSQYQIERVLYHYDYSDATTETQQRRAARR